MARSSRTVLNRRTLNALQAGFVDGLEDLGQAVLAATHPPHDDPAGQGLQVAGDYGVWANGRKVAGGATRKPRSVRTGKGITLVVGFPFPARFNEIGTVHQPARPFLTPAVLAETPNTPDLLGRKVRARLSGLP